MAHKNTDFITLLWTVWNIHYKETFLMSEKLIQRSVRLTLLALEGTYRHIVVVRNSPVWSSSVAQTVSCLLHLLILWHHQSVYFCNKEYVHHESPVAPPAVSKTSHFKPLENKPVLWPNPGDTPDWVLAGHMLWKCRLPLKLSLSFFNKKNEGF